MGKVYCILGKSASGKSTIEKILEQKGLERVVSYTTRPMRENEVNGVDYKYISEEEFLSFDKLNLFVEKTTYRDWHYGILKNDIEDSGYNHIVVIEPNGYKQIKKVLGDNAIGIYIKLQDKERLIRALNREINPDVDEIIRRFISDKDLFEGIEKEVSFVFENWDCNSVADEILKIVRGV